MSGQLTPGRIRDPVHGYVVFTAIERALLDHPVAQRLRYVGQSAAAHLVFPEMRVSRMAHSLGAMHLASRFLEASLANAADDEREQVVRGCRALVDRHAQLGLGPDAERTIARQGLLAGRDQDQRDRVAVLLVEQGLRLASLLHDLGHLPFSHDFELALDVYVRADPQARARTGSLFAQGPGGDAVHERIGYALASVVQTEVFSQRLAGTPLSKPAEVALLIARDVLHAPAAPELDAGEHAAVLSWLHSLVAGELDVDRADYVLRDVRHYGLAAAGYDLDRLVDHLTPVLVDGRMETAVLPQGVSAAEAFLLARFRMYTWAVYHHKIQQAAAGLRVAIVDALANADAQLRTFLSDIAAIAGGQPPSEAVERFADYDDAWWTEVLRNRLRTGVDPRVEPWLALFTRRRPGPVSLWKRASEFPPTDRAAWNARLPGRDDYALLKEWQRVRTELYDKQHVLVERLPFRPWRADNNGESQLKVRIAPQPVPLTQLSSLVRALESAWSEELQILAFADSPGRMQPAEVLDRLEPALRL